MRSFAFIFGDSKGVGGKCLGVKLSDANVTAAMKGEYSVPRFMKACGSGMKGWSCVQKKSNNKFGVATGSGLKELLEGLVKEALTLQYIK